MDVMSVNPLGYLPQIPELVGALAIPPEERKELFPSVTAQIVSGGEWLPSSPITNISLLFPPAKAPQKIQIDLREFDLRLETSINDIKVNEDYTIVLVEALIDPGVSALLTLENQPGKQAGTLEIKSISIRFEVSDHKPRAHFIASSLYAMVALADSVNIVLPAMNIDVKVSFSLPLSEVSKFLQGRQTYYGLMVIERSTGLRLSIPEFISAEDMGALSFVYHAIVERTFHWLANFITLPVPATMEILAWLDSLQSTEPGGPVYKLAFGPAPSMRKIFGQVIPLGPETVFVEEGLFQNRNEVRRELAQLDGHIVFVVIRPLSGMGRYELPDAPRLPAQPWDDKIEGFVKLEDGLSDRLAVSYNNLAASTLRDLTPDEIESITTRPEIDYSTNQTEE